MENENSKGIEKSKKFRISKKIIDDENLETSRIEIPVEKASEIEEVVNVPSETFKKPLKERKKRETNSLKQLDALRRGREKLKSNHIQRKILKEEENEAMRVLIEATKKNTDIINELKKSIGTKRAPTPLPYEESESEEQEVIEKPKPKQRRETVVQQPQPRRPTRIFV